MDMDVERSIEFLKKRLTGVTMYRGSTWQPVATVLEFAAEVLPVIQNLASFAGYFNGPDTEEVMLHWVRKNGEGHKLTKADVMTAAHALGRNLALCENCGEGVGEWRGCWGFMCTPCYETVMANSIAEQSDGS